MFKIDPIIINIFQYIMYTIKYDIYLINLIHMVYNIYHEMIRIR